MTLGNYSKREEFQEHADISITSNLLMILKHAKLKANVINMQYQFAPDYKKASMKLASKCANTDIELMKIFVNKIRDNQLE